MTIGPSDLRSYRSSLQPTSGRLTQTINLGLTFWTLRASHDECSGVQSWPHCHKAISSATSAFYVSCYEAPKVDQQSTAASPAVQHSTEDISSSKAIPTPDTIALVPLWQRLGPLSKAFSAYGRAQRKRPYVTQLCSSLVIYLCGDLSAQNIGGDDYNPWRTVRNMTIGGICSIPSYKW